ncbi:HAMP domain-containing histidine kinase [Geodermatophilus sabuli]|uniref:histidine kinase n=1 Tax=Geodermatophilus sabuli TaxID=1564158 RepID=A0A7K3W518_9ACTN|nr:HAMP domain-containing histidine kinase [Geodermatophilus sabuli]NEK58917.1 HAMP domain-containing histidine kinase [Geodermatophilus sabuli]
MTLAANPFVPVVPPTLLTEVLRLVRGHLPRARRSTAADHDDERPTGPDALVRALCHDMRSPLASLEALLGSLGQTASGPDEALDLARAQTAHLSSMLRTAAATVESPRTPGPRRLDDVLRASVSASGLPRDQLTVRVEDGAGAVTVADARVQRILTNLLENAHRHGAGAPVRLAVRRRPGWVDLAVTQAVVRPELLVGYLGTELPPPDLTGLGLWSVRRQTRELGGQVVWDGDGGALTLTVQLPDR